MVPSLPKWSFQQRMPIQPKEIENHKGDGHIRCRSGKQIGCIVLASEPFLQIEEAQSPFFVESDDLTVSNQLLAKPSGLFDQLRKLSGNSP